MHGTLDWTDDLSDDARFAIIAGAILLVVVAITVFLLTYRTETNAAVVQLSWSRAIDIQSWRTVQESDWSVPSGGRQTNSYPAIHHYERYVSGSHEECSTVNKRTTCETELDYSSRPVYQTKYDYDIERWIVVRTPEKHGVGTAPVWPDVSDLKEHAQLQIGDERVGTRTSRYTVAFTGGYALDMTQERWVTFQPGQKVTLILNFFKQALDVRA